MSGIERVLTDEMLHRVQHAIEKTLPQSTLWFFSDPCEDGGKYDDEVIVDGDISLRALVGATLAALAEEEEQS